MKLKNLFTAGVLLSFAFNLNLAAVNAVGNRVPHHKFNAKSKSTPPAKHRGGTVAPITDEIKVVVEGPRAGFEKPFVAVAYDKNTYESFRKLSTQVPDIPADTFDRFKPHAVIAVFLGQRPTSGYGVKVEVDAQQRITVTETKPAPNMMVMQVLTSPFKVVSVPITEGQLLSLSFGPTLTVGAATYRVTTGEFTERGGIAGREVKSRLAGSIRVMQHDAWITLLFDLNTTGIKSTGALQTVATGMSFMDGKFALAQVDPGTLIERPHTALRAEGTLVSGKLSLHFESIPGMPADGFSGKGSVEATLLGAR
jgi:hypothetical protein